MSQADFKFIGRHEVLSYPEYEFEIDEYRSASDEQLLLAHFRVFYFSPSILKRIDREWRAFRACVSAPLFATAETEDDKWERFVSRLGFVPLCQVVCINGTPRRLFISAPQDHNGLFQRRNKDAL